jgi:hypothetical protein
MKRGVWIFLLGAVCGAVPTFFLTRKKYEKFYADVADKAIAGVKESYKKRHEQELLAEKAHSKPPVKEVLQKIREGEPIFEEEDDTDEMKEAESIIAENRYIPPLEERLEALPYVISPDEFGEEYGAGNILCLTYYKGDNKLVDDIAGQTENIEDMIGLEALKHFGEYEQDIVRVRNKRYMLDIEVCLDRGSYGEDTGPYNPADDFDEVDE